MPDYDAFNAARKEARSEGPTFRLAGKDWQCLPGAEIDAGSLMSALLDATLPGFAHEMLRLTLGEKQYGQLLTVCRDKGIIIDTLVEISMDLVKDYTGRPTAPSSSTASGQASDGDGSKQKPRRKASAA